VGLLGGAAIVRTQGAIRAADYSPAPDTAENRRFRGEFSKRFARTPTDDAARGYDAGRLLIEALRATPGAGADREHLAAALKRVSFVGPRGLVHADPERGAALDQIAIVQERDSAGADEAVLDRVPWTAAANPCAAPAVN